MQREQAIGQFEEFIFARLEPGEDPLLAIWDIAERNDIKAGYVVAGPGVLNNLVFQRFPRNPKTCKISIDVYPLEGPLLCNMTGVIGYVDSEDGASADALPLPFVEDMLENDMDMFNMMTSHGIGTPYVHCHFDVATKDFTVMGHLMPGASVLKSVNKLNVPSEFTVVIAKKKGIEFGTVLRKDGFGHFVRQK